MESILPEEIIYLVMAKLKFLDIHNLCCTAKRFTILGENKHF